MSCGWLGDAIRKRLFVAAVLSQQFRHFLVAIKLRIVQRRPAVVVLRIDIGLVGQQQLCHVFMVTSGRHLQRCRALPS